jgi:predicted murein hydrolase (TIGR00659 family)
LGQPSLRRDGLKLVNTIATVWVYLAASPLLWLTLTLIAYGLAVRIYEAVGMHPAATPLLTATALIVLALLFTGTPYETYFEGAQFIHFLLGPTTVALAIPLIDNIDRVRRSLVPIALALLAGSFTAIVSAVAIAAVLGAPPSVLVSLAPKSVTAPVAMALSQEIGGIPALTAVLVILTGVMGAIVGPPLMNLLRVEDHAARGFAIGVASHGLGTARAFQLSELAGVFAGLAMALNGMLTAVLLPLLVPLVPR